VKVGDLVRDFPDEIDRFTPRIGVVVKVGPPDPYEAARDIEVWFDGQVEEWDEYEIEVINESR
jgi:hypothetical protein